MVRKKEEYISKVKKKDSQSSIVQFNVKEIPQEPCAKPSRSEKALHEVLKKLFLKRPLWTRNALEMNIPAKEIRKLKTVLPTVAYYFSDGPWRTCWARIGYDPRKNSESRVYQVIDFRVPPNIKLPNENTSSRGGYKAKWEKPRRQKKDVMNMDVEKLSQGNVEKTIQERETRHLKERHTFSRPPLNRQSLYQSIDINIPKVQKLLEKETSKCTKTSGWFSNVTLKKIRTTMLERLKEMLQKEEEEETEDNKQEKEKEEENEMEVEEKKSDSESEIEDNPPQTTTTENLTTQPTTPLSTTQNELNTNEQVNLFANLIQIVQDDEEIQPFATLDQENIEVDMLPLPVGADESDESESHEDNEEDDSEVDE